MKKFLLATAASALLAGSAHAADLPRRAAPPVFTAVPVFTWSGFYAGLHYGYGFTDNPNIRTTGNQLNTIANVNQNFRPGTLRSEVDGFTRVGGGGGINWQLTPGSGFVVGAAFDLTWTDLVKRTGFTGPFNPAAGGGNVSVFTQNLDYLGTINGKLGYGFDRFLVYATGGLAFGRVEYAANFFGARPGLPLQFANNENYRFETGYNFGGGVEYALPTDSFLNYLAIGRLLGIKSDITLKAEYIRYDLGSRTLLVVGPNGSYNSRFATEGNLIRAGFNYKFGS